MPRAKAGHKRQREDDACGEKRLDKEGADVVPPPKKRAQHDNDVDNGHHQDTHSSAHLNDSMQTSARISDGEIETHHQVLPAEVQHLTDQYQFSTMSILSSSKIESRVRNLLARTEISSLAKTDTKPEVVVLSAIAKVANKLGSIVEITKHQIQIENGKWWQYSKLHGELRGFQPKRAKQTGNGKTLGDLDEERCQDDAAGAKVADSTYEPSTEELKDQAPVNQDESDDASDDFETIANPRTREPMINSGNGNREKVRNTPVMTIFFSRVPVPTLKELYG